ncbi:MAG: MFS transporter, partial [bacterium]|nr:MFS transporter [bacterium]
MAEEITGTAPGDTAFFGHPRGLATLFFTEFWERFSYYGLRPLLVLFMTAAASEGGFGTDAGTASNVYAIYAATVYLLSLPGGWLADRFLGQRRAVLYGGILIAAGNFMLVIHSAPTFFLGLGVITIGTGLLKPNVSTIVGQLYRSGDARRDGGFSIFYMGINLGALLAPIACGWVGERIDWHYGFALAGIGMTLGTLQYWRGGKHLGEAGLHPSPAEDAETQRRLLNRFWLWAGGAAAVIATLAVLHVTGILALSVEAIANGFGGVLSLVVIGVFGWLLFGGNWTAAERRRLWVVAGLFAASTVFFSVFEQAPTTLNLFARDITDRNVAGFEVPVSWFQTLNPLFIILLAPVFAWLWARLGSRDPSSQAKFVLGLIGASLGFAVLIGPAIRF